MPDSLQLGKFEMYISRRIFIFVLALSSVHLFAQTNRPHADRIFLNGKIWTADDAHPIAQALAISGDKLLAVGSNLEVKAFASPDTAIVDLHGLLVVPGFEDSHLHFPGPS